MSWQETIKLQGDKVFDQVKRLIHEGNVRRVVVKQGDKTVAEFSLTIGVVGAAIAPPLAAIGALVALLTDCSVELERVHEDEVPAADAPEAIAASGADALPDETPSQPA